MLILRFSLFLQNWNSASVLKPKYEEKQNMLTYFSNLSAFNDIIILKKLFIFTFSKITFAETYLRFPHNIYFSQFQRRYNFASWTVYYNIFGSGFFFGFEYSKFLTLRVIISLFKRRSILYFIGGKYSLKREKIYTNLYKTYNKNTSDKL